MPPVLHSKDTPKQPATTDKATKQNLPALGAKYGGNKGNKAKRKQPRQAKDEPESEGRDLFSSLPLDVLLEVCADLNPGTLLSISQTSKAVRATLLSRSALPLWTAARSAAGVPHLEAGDVSQPKYAYLIFGTACQVCGNSEHKTEVDYFVRVSCCRKCLRQKLIRYGAHACVHPSDSAAGESRKDAKPFLPFAANYFLPSQPDVLAASDKLFSIDLDNLSSDETEAAEGASPLENTDTRVCIQMRSLVKRKAEVAASTMFAIESGNLDAHLAAQELKREQRATKINQNLVQLGCNIAE
ncbi:hypothetical protein JCM11641_001665 [Rhodosporidiobolus odoratus]